jgi:CPA1 family monovalent cation:H+ antiporter
MLLFVSTGVYFLSRRIRVPYTVLLVAVGAFVLVPLAMTPWFSFLKTFTLTPELLFYVFLPILIFESAYNISIRRLAENAWSISVLAVVSLIVSTAVIGGALFYLLPLVGMEVPLILCLLFGALISATDPVAVLALFKEVGAPRRLTLLFEGESIFNDGTAVALFLVILEVALHGWHGASSVIEGLSTFFMMVFAGGILGLILGGFFVKAVGWARSNEYVQIALMITLAHFTFIFSDYLSQNLTILGHSIHISAIISTTIASMVIGNYGRLKVLPHAHEFVDKFWGATALLANSVAFLLIGLVFASLPVRVTDFVMPTIIAILIVASARAISVYGVVLPFNLLAIEEHIPRAWQHLLAWGSLRGALALIMVLLIPNDLVLAGWDYVYSPRDFLLALTIGCIFTTLFFKATTIIPLARKLNIGAFTDLEHMSYGAASAFVHARALERLTKFREKGYLDNEITSRLIEEHNKRFMAASVACKERIQARGVLLGERILRMYAIGIEKSMLKRLYEYGEVNERVYHRVLGKLTLQYEQLEMRGGASEDVSRHLDSKDVFDHIARISKRMVGIKTDTTLEDTYLYYRTQTVLSRTALRDLALLGNEKCEQLFGSGVYQKIVETYEAFLDGSNKKMEAIFEEDPVTCSMLSEQIARRSILEAESEMLEELSEHEMITPKVAVAIRADVERAAEYARALEEQTEEAVERSARLS